MKRGASYGDDGKTIEEVIQQVTKTPGLAEQRAAVNARRQHVRWAWERAKKEKTFPLGVSSLKSDFEKNPATVQIVGALTNATLSGAVKTWADLCRWLQPWGL